MNTITLDIPSHTTISLSFSNRAGIIAASVVLALTLVAIIL